MNAALNNGPAQRAPSYYSATLNDRTEYPTLNGTEQVGTATVKSGEEATVEITSLTRARRGVKGTQNRLQ